jgi:hypothetical protein
MRRLLHSARGRPAHPKVDRVNENLGAFWVAPIVGSERASNASGLH